ncbi:MarR family winged helix-turn-helix transcriptional regulator [Herbiconiux moechotypicola]|uniref:HTH marR-type domain-containing protein n=1 Tax=Herbiconiux moechotypicola TaxID=637393 RepID=A0ABN3DB88_9MICO|nr:MarR family winged helix-turn-helix transcriptional regulator [Herbiconiux moechotypicola]MCS5728921.1 MarR family winged helix-turn-helix transcriptional regulator [Herbiconiux moechotypicola]
MTHGRNPDAPWSRDELADSGAGPASGIAVALRDIDTHSRAFERKLGSALAVNPTDLAAMQHLIQNGPLTPSELALRLGVTTAASTLVVDRLVALGHAERHPHQHDRRKIVVVPSRASVDRAVDLLLPVIAGIAGVVDDLTPAERATVERFLHSVDTVYRTAAEGP